MKRMNLTIHHRNVRMNLVFASLIAEKLYQLESKLAVTSATVTLEKDKRLNGEMRILVEIETAGSRLLTVGVDPEPRTALLKLLASRWRMDLKELVGKYTPVTSTNVPRLRKGTGRSNRSPTMRRFQYRSSSCSPCSCIGG